jgi:hypothetical protein
MTHAPSFVFLARSTIPDFPSPIHFFTRPQLLTRI